MSAIIIYITSPSNEVSKSLAEKLLEKKLAACVNIFPEISSVFSWEGEVKRESESLMMIKSSQGLFEELKEVIKLNHPYKVPEIIATPIIDGDKEYLDWLKNSLKKEEANVY